jgi:hypothetical protein
MNTTFGLRGTIQPAERFSGHTESFQNGPFQISIQDGVFEIGYEDESLADEAKSIAARYISAYSFSKDRPFTLNLNQSWKKNPNGTKDIAITISDSLHLTDEVGALCVSTTDNGNTTVHVYNGRDLGNETELVQKSFRDAAMADALRYFSEEVVGDDRPLYGVYKSLEALTRALGKDGREKLSRLVGQSKDYVSDIMQTAQIVRHHADPNAKQMISEEECRNRAKELIVAYSKTLT